MNKQSARKRLSRGLTILCAVLYTLCGLIWLWKGLGDPAGPGWFHMALGLVWLAGAVIWAVRAWRERKKEEP